MALSSSALMRYLLMVCTGVLHCVYSHGFLCAACAWNAAISGCRVRRGAEDIDNAALIQRHTERFHASFYAALTDLLELYPPGCNHRALRDYFPITILYAASIFVGMRSWLPQPAYSGIFNSFLMSSSDFPAFTIAPTRSTSNA